MSLNEVKKRFDPLPFEPKGNTILPGSLRNKKLLQLAARVFYLDRIELNAIKVRECLNKKQNHRF